MLPLHKEYDQHQQSSDIENCKCSCLRDIEMCNFINGDVVDQQNWTVWGVPDPEEVPIILQEFWFNQSL